MHHPPICFNEPIVKAGPRNENGVDQLVVGPVPVHRVEPDTGSRVPEPPGCARTIGGTNGLNRTAKPPLGFFR